uniref:Uncharacterized protein n=1 Tax=Lotus japonicus TaxID=34305 RepID=I3SFS1_LOTJA|nr:unknown [Lotus japonicus]
MEKALTKVSSLKVGLGDSWFSKKAKEEFSNISQDISTFSSTVEEKAKWVFNKLKGKPLKSLPDLLREYNLPPGLFPQNVICYEFDEVKGKLIVYLPSACEVSFKDSSVEVRDPSQRGSYEGKALSNRGNENKGSCMG